MWLLRLLQMHWNKIIPVVFFGIFLVSQLGTSPIYAQEKEPVAPEYKELDSEPIESDILYLDGKNGKIPVDLATFYAELISAIFFGITTWLLIKDYFGGEYETKLQVRQMRDDSYGRIREHHHDLIRLQIEQPKLMEIFKPIEKPKEYEGKDEIELNTKQMQIFNFYLAEFDLYERVYLLLEDPAFEKVDALEWITWLIYLEQISHHWLFKHTYEKTRELFYEEMMNAIKSDIIGIKPHAKKHLKNLREKEEKVSKAKEDENQREEIPILDSTKETITEIYEQVIGNDYTPSKQVLNCYGYLLEKSKMTEEQIRKEVKEIKTDL